ncbi:polyamine aminopropyltransferase [Alkalibaculum sp. M08DMB]|uniref:Polyamine aminopropyltransferase n=1 Tax=Alkalibaculum sporogenes TaxID=2655001 RepID=A0A6A7KC03_9FIRM|nr:polyamine aminopropyltransferase [Alkalibaculum sporogenes]
MPLWYNEEQTEGVSFGIKIKEQILSEESQFQTIDIYDTYEFGKLFTLDGLVMLTEKDEFIYHDMIVHVPMAVNTEIKNVLVIGGGDGGTVRELTRYNSIEKIDMVEIDEMVVRASQKHLPFTASKLTDPRVNLFFEDGIVFVKNAQNSMYDLIIVDSTDPIGPGEGLFTKEFYDQCFRILTSEGILINQHESPFYPQFSKEMKRAHNKIKNIFPISMVYQAHIPTYPSGHWLFGFSSKKFHPLEDLKSPRWEMLKLKTKYYNSDLHLGSFALPTYVKEMLEEEE